MITPSPALIDLHRHTDGSVRPQTILELAEQHDLPLPRTQSLLTAPYIPASAVAERFALFRLPERWDRWPTHLQVTAKATFAVKTITFHFWCVRGGMTADQY